MEDSPLMGNEKRNNAHYPSPTRAEGLQSSDRGSSDVVGIKQRG
ncbi:MAG: hypothetical protein ABI644_02285 [Arenimonas sp.]